MILIVILVIVCISKEIRTFRLYNRSDKERDSGGGGLGKREVGDGGREEGEGRKFRKILSAQSFQILRLSLLHIYGKSPG